MKNRILVVEDNPVSSELLCAWLKQEGFDVESATDVAGGKSVLNQRPPDAVLLDVQLGPDDGIGLAQWMREQPNLHHIPVIAVSAHAMVSEQERMMQAGCNACIAKPVDFHLLREYLRQWLPLPTPPIPRD